MNWGNRLLITFIVFAGGMSFLVFRSMGSTSELVESDYYQKELTYQSQLDASARGQRAGGIQLSLESGAIQLSWPTDQKDIPMKGEAWFYCAFDKKRDRRIPLETSQGEQRIDTKQLLPGQYTVKLNWSDGTNTYYQENTVDITP